MRDLYLDVRDYLEEGAPEVQAAEKVAAQAQTGAVAKVGCRRLVALYRPSTSSQTCFEIRCFYF